MGATDIRRFDGAKGLPYLDWLVEKASCTYTALGRGAVAADTLFTVTGDIIIMNLWGVVNTSLTSGAGPELEVGVVGNTARIITQIADVTTLLDGHIFCFDVTQVGAGILAGSSGSSLMKPLVAINDGADIIQTVGTATITAGQIDFYCLWAPVEAGATVVGVDS